MDKKETAIIRTPEKSAAVSFSFEDLLNERELKELPQGQLIIDTLLFVKKSYEADPEFTFLGEGDTAKVFQVEGGGAENACIKVTHKLKESHNTIDKEMELHNEAYQAGVRVPQPVISIEMKSGTGYLVMERIKGNSVKDHVNRGVPFPDGFDPKVFIQKLKAELKKLHDNKIFHRDLHEGNVMIDEQGNPVIIDLGASKKIHLSSEDPYQEKHLNKIITFVNDDHAVTKMLRVIIDEVTRQKEEGGIVT